MKRFILLLFILLLSAMTMAVADTLVLPDSTIMIEPEAFYGVDAETIVLPEGVTFIGDNAFGGSETLREVYVPEALMDREKAALTGSENAFFISLSDDPIDNYSYTVQSDHVVISKYVGAKSEARIPRRIDRKPVIVIGTDAFKDNTDLTRVVIPEGVTYIGSGAFDGCANLTDIVFPSTLTDFNTNAFNGCGSAAEETFYFILPDGITRTVYDNDNHGFPGCNAVLVCNPDTATAYHMGVYITFPGQYDYRYRYVHNSHTLYLMAYVGSSAEISLPGNVALEIIADNVFKDCTFLTKVIIPDGVTTIGKGAFENCVNLSEISLPGSLTSIQHRAFRDCGSAVQITDKPLVLVLPGNITGIVGYGDDDDTASNASFKYCAFARVAGRGTTTAESLRAAHYGFYNSYNAETGALGNYIHWDD